jgi:SAM-dependent methyltransferase
VIERWPQSSYRELVELYQRLEGDALRRLWAEHEEQAPRRGEQRWADIARYAALADCGLKSEIRNPKSEMSPAMLDVGCGAGSALFGLARHAALAVGIDIMLSDLLLAKKRFAEAGIANVAFACGSASELPFADASFGVLNATDVIEHVDDPGRLLAEARRVMGPGGVFFFNSPNRFSLLSREPHVKLWGVGWLPRRWAEPYVRWRLGKAYRGKRLLSLFELRRRLRAEFGRCFAIRALLPRGRLARALIRPLETLARPILPQHNAVAWRRESRTRDEAWPEALRGHEGRGR